ncbi:MAG: type II toxin-antitoxin system HipA family toxin YjjJ [Steroidobacteraceae bacterium]|nr:type II toxin-antitoxin system HipA family toxin YjjJ [Steroidobacteraceae bacterium]
MPIDAAQYVLRRLEAGPASAIELAQLIGISQSSVARLLRELIASHAIVRLGSTRGSRYARLRTVDRLGSDWPLRQVDSEGGIKELGTLNALTGSSYYFEPDVSGLKWSGLSEGLPYFLQDQRPAGFLGRTVPAHYPELGLPQRVVDWNDDHYLRYLTQRGSDTVGDLILGDAALNIHLASHRQDATRALDHAERSERYPQLANDVMTGGFPGSSAHGEHPKFTAVLKQADGFKHVLVKFSPLDSTEVGQRWSDLLTAEHLAHEVLKTAGVNAAESRILKCSGRTFLEVDRFDRKNIAGRIGVTSLFAIDSALYGKLDNWIEAATRLCRDSQIDAATLETVRLGSTFGALIANTDRHFGNLAFYDRYDGKFSLAPIYDMLPMLLAPEHDQVMARVFVPPDPASDTLRAYGRARELAELYWHTCAEDERISMQFRSICQTFLNALEKLPRAGAFSVN